MMVKRVSYFTFIVAITTIATVSSCHRIKEKKQQSLNNTTGISDKNSFVFIEEISKKTTRDLNGTLELAKVLQQKGLRSGKFRIATDNEGNEDILSIYFIFDKDYKGQVSARIFDNKHSGYDKLAIASENKPEQEYYFDLTFDKRDHIACKNLILLE